MSRQATPLAIVFKVILGIGTAGLAAMPGAAEAYSFYSPLTAGCHEKITSEALRAVRLEPRWDVRSHEGAQGFRVGPEHRKIRARTTGAQMFHYGWARPAWALHQKRELDKPLYPWRRSDPSLPLLPWIPGIRRFTCGSPVSRASSAASRRLGSVAMSRPTVPLMAR